MKLHENPVAVATILPVEFCVLVLLELLGVRDEKLSSQHSAMIVFRCSLNKVLICALELSRSSAIPMISSTGFPVRSTILSA